MKKIAVLSLLIAALITVASAQNNKQERPRQISVEPIAVPSQTPAPGRTETTEDDGGVLRVETSLVTIPVSVTSRDGRSILDLQQSDFKIFEDGREEQIEIFAPTEQPITVVLLLDTSLSSSFKISEIQNAAITFVNQLKPQDKVLVAEFDAKVHVLSDFTNDRARLQKAIRKADFGDGTSLYDAVGLALGEKLEKIEGRKAIVLFTDGVDTTSYRTDGNNNIREAETSDVQIYSVFYNTLPDVQERLNRMSPEEREREEQLLGITPEDYERGKRFLNELTSRTGGRVFQADSTQNLENAFVNIAEELKRQYSIGYYPSETAQPGQRKQVKVLVNRPNIVIKARESYVVGASATQAVTETKNSKKQKKRN